MERSRFVGTGARLAHSAANDDGRCSSHVSPGRSGGTSIRCPRPLVLLNRMFWGLISLAAASWKVSGGRQDGQRLLTVLVRRFVDVGHQFDHLALDRQKHSKSAAWMAQSNWSVPGRRGENRFGQAGFPDDQSPISPRDSMSNPAGRHIGQIVGIQRCQGKRYAPC